MTKKRVLIAMSGGIDSSVAAILLQEQGYELIGATFRTYDSISESCMAREKGCCSMDSIAEARHLAQRLGFEHHIVDARELFRETVIRNFIDEYLDCRTPNPCVLCNPVIKWGLLLQFADEMHCDLLATGHYARLGTLDGRTFLRKGKDLKKDQTYFLWQLTCKQLQRTLFPLGELTKPEVRALAAEHGFMQLSQKKESEEICFVTDNDYRTFLYGEVPDLKKQSPPGNFITKDGAIVGRHQGLFHYTIGQRKGLGIALGVPTYVVALDKAHNNVVLGSKEDLASTSLFLQEYKLTKYEDFEDGMPVDCRVRYRSASVGARLYHSDGGIRVEFDAPVESVTPGQSAVFYEGDDLIGGGIIEFRV